MISQGLKILKRAIDERPKGGMQTGMPKIQLREDDAVRAVAELEWSQNRIAELEAQLKEREWISVGFPVNEQDCVFIYKGSSYTGFWDADVGAFDSSEIGWCSEFTAWMPLPQPPKDNNHE